MLLPQGIFYILLLSVIFERCYDNANHSVYKEKAIILWKIIMGVILFALGFLCETCINFEVLKKIL
jgi:dipeptide/tripeptide permease